MRQERYETLHQDGRQLIQGWFERAAENRDCPPDESFEPFIFLWIALNAWASCVTLRDTDRAWRDALGSDRMLSERFSALVAEPATRTSSAARAFSALWPIFSVVDLRRRGRATVRPSGASARSAVGRTTTSGEEAERLTRCDTNASTARASP